MIRYIVPSVNSHVKLERCCPYCRRKNGNIHSSIRYRRISDIKVKAIPQQRMRCPFCSATWTIRSEGVSDGKQRSDSLITIGVILYMFGLSYRSVEKFLPLLDCRGSKSTIERDVAAAGQKVKALHLSAPQMRVRVLGADGTGARMAGKKRKGLLFFVDIERGKLVCVEPVNETDSAKVRRHVQKVMHQVGAEQLLTDELSVYSKIVPEDQHKICLAHWRKSKCRRAYELHRKVKAEGLKHASDDMLELVQLVRAEPRPPTVPSQLERLVRRYINCRKGVLWKVNQLLQHIERSWESISNDSGDRTNNTTERIIGLTYKVRAKTMRGFKSLDKVLAHPYLSEFLSGEGGVCDLRQVV